jgi:predicted nucleic acid-binding protein
LTLTVIYDANVFYSAPLRDFLIELAKTGLFRARWTDAIHDEWIRAVLKNRPDLQWERFERTRNLMDQAAPSCLVKDYEAIIERLSLPDANDRHVLAAAISAQAHVIVTKNLRDFPSKVLRLYGMEAAHPDAFVLSLMRGDLDTVIGAARKLRSRLSRPPKSLNDFLATLERQELKSTAAELRLYASLL